MAVTDASMTITTHANFIPEVWEDGVLSAVEFSGMIQKKVTRDYEGSIKQFGDTVHVPRASNLQTSTKAAGIGNTIVFEAPTEGVQDLVINVHEYAAFLLEDVVEIQSQTNLRQIYERKIGYALARGREITLANLFQSLSQSVGTYGVEMTSDDYLAGLQKFIEAGLMEGDPVPDENFSLFLSPAAYTSALKIDVFTNRDYNPTADAIGRAYFGKLYGFTAYVSNLLRSPAAGQHDAVMFHRGSFALAVQKEVPVKSQYMLRNLGWGVVGYNLYGVAELNYPPETPGGGAATDNRGVLIKTV